MSAGKFSIFVTVVALHACLLGIVYVATRSPEADAGQDIKNSVVNKTPVEKNTITSKSSGLSKTVKSEPKYRIHTVSPNDYLGKIASRYKVSSKSIIELNNLKDPNRISRGQKLKIPAN